MDFHQRLPSLTIMTYLYLQNETRTMVYLLTFLKSTSPQAHACQTHLFCVDTCDIATTWSKQHCTYRSLWQECGLLNLPRITALRFNDFGQLRHTCTCMDCLSDTHLSLGSSIGGS